LAADWADGGESPVVGASDVVEHTWTIGRPPAGEHDRIQVHRYKGEGEAQAALLYLPGTNMNGEVAIASEDHNLWIFLARRGVVVYTLDYRTHTVSSGPLEDASFMRPWTLTAFVDDAREALLLVRQEESGLDVFVAGFSRGVWLGYGLVGTEEAGSIAGFVALDGGFKGHRPQDRYDLERAQKAFEKSGNWASDVAGSLGWERRDRLMRAASAAPDGPALGADFDSVGEQVASILQGAWRPGGLANPHDGVSRPQILARLLADYDRYYPSVQNIESAAIADYDDHPTLAVDDRWGELELPVLYFGATNMGATWVLDGVYSAAKSGSRDVTLNLLENYGHLDVLVGERAREDVFEPLLSWLDERTK